MDIGAPACFPNGVFTDIVAGVEKVGVVVTVFDKPSNGGPDCAARPVLTAVDEAKVLFFPVSILVGFTAEVV